MYRCVSKSNSWKITFFLKTDFFAKHKFSQSPATTIKLNEIHLSKRLEYLVRLRYFYCGEQSPKQYYSLFLLVSSSHALSTDETQFSSSRGNTSNQTPITVNNCHRLALLFTYVFLHSAKSVVSGDVIKISSLPLSGIALFLIFITNLAHMAFALALLVPVCFQSFQAVFSLLVVYMDEVFPLNLLCF